MRHPPCIVAALCKACAKNAADFVDAPALSCCGVCAHRGRPLRGVLFWRWDLQVYAGMAPADYGVQVADTTFDLIRDNASKVKMLAAQQPPDSSCKVGCWVPDVHSGTFSTVNRCAATLPHRICCLMP